MSTDSSPYRIRLRGPWEYAWLEEGSGVPTEMDTVTMPVSWQELFGTRSGTALFRRRFNSPSNLREDQPVRIVVSQVGGDVAFRLNGRTVAVATRPNGEISGDVTDLLEDFNVLEIKLSCNPDDAPVGLWQPVILEIEE
jgi:hypothetical protein